jgi:riboflavin kinase/FMN adenylyltransferase
VETFRDARAVPRPLRAPTIALGNFDGVHTGHQKLLNLALERARARGSESVALTFDPHPATVLAPELAPPLITGLRRKTELIAASGIDVLVVHPFDIVFASHSPEQFAREILSGALNAAEVVVGYDFTFGRDRAGNAKVLEQLGERLGFRTFIVEPVALDGLVASSTKIRQYVLEGRLGAASLLLGRPFELTGKVVPGMGRGRTLGIPTANLQLEAVLLPPPGVYAAWAETGEEGRRYAAVVNVGMAPTFADRSRPVVEAHLLEFRGDLYGRRIALLLKQCLRAEARFTTPEALVRQIHADIARATELLQ